MAIWRATSSEQPQTWLSDVTASLRAPSHSFARLRAPSHAFAHLRTPAPTWHTMSISSMAYEVDIAFKCCNCGSIEGENRLYEATWYEATHQQLRRLSFLSWTMSDTAAYQEGFQQRMQDHGICQVMYRPDFLCRKCFTTAGQSKEHS